MPDPFDYFIREEPFQGTFHTTSSFDHFRRQEPAKSVALSPATQVSASDSGTATESAAITKIGANDTDGGTITETASADAKGIIVSDFGVFSEAWATQPQYYRDTIMLDGPRAYWRMEEPSGTVVRDTAGGLTLGAGSGTPPTPGVPGILPGYPGSMARGFSSVGTFLNGGNAPFKYNLFTWEFWVKRTRTNADEDICDQYNGGAQFLIGSDGTLRLYQSYGGMVSKSTNLKILDTNAHHVVVSRAGIGGQVVFYLDAVSEVGTVETLYNVDYSVWAGYNIFIGSQWGNYPFDGTIDEFAIYDYVLAPSHVANHYNVGYGQVVAQGVDSGTAVEAYAINKTMADSGTAVESASVTRVLYSDVDVGTATESASFLYAPAGTDAGTLSEAASPVASISDNDASGTTTETASLVARIPGAAPYPSLVLSDGAINYWRLNEVSGTTARDILGNINGVYGGGYTLNQPGAVVGDAAVALNGTTGNVAINNVSVAGDCSFECWSYLTDAAAVQHAILAQSGTNPGRLRLLIQGTTIFLGIINPSSVEVTFNLSGQPSVLNVWTHWVVVRSGTNVTLYRNGVAVPSGTFTIPAGTTAINQFGQQAGSYYFGGSIDEIAVYPTALTPAQILAHYRAAPLATAFDVNGITTETGSVRVPVPASDSGTMTETSHVDQGAAVGGTDSGSLAEATSLQTTVTTSDAIDTASEVTTVKATVSAADSAVGADTVALFVPVSVADAGVGTESSTLAGKPQTGDIGSSTETGAVIAQITATDAGGSTEVGLVTFAVTLTDSGTATEAYSLTVSRTDTDSGSIVESASPVASLTTGDSGSATESVSARVYVTDSDLAMAAEVVALVAKLASGDNGSIAEGTTTRAQIIAIDSGTLIDNAIPDIYTDDYAVGIDTELLHVWVEDQDNGFMSEVYDRQPPLVFFTGAPAGYILAMSMGTFSTPASGTFRSASGSQGSFGKPTTGRILK